MAKRTYKVGMPDEVILPKQEELETKPQVSVIEISEEKILKSLKETSSPIYQVQVNHPSLRRRKDPTENSEVIGLITDKGVYDVYAELNGWAQLEDRSWVMLQFCSKIR